MRKSFAYFITITISTAAALAVALFLGEIATTIAQNDGPQLLVTPSQAVANQRISLTATGFTPNSEIGEVAEGEEQVSGISIGGEDIPWDRINGGNTVSINSDGEWSTTVDLPLTATTTAAGSKSIQATDSEGSTVSVTLTIPERSITITPNTGRVGTLAMIRGVHFPATNGNGSRFSMSFTYKSGTKAGSLGSAVPDTSGAFEVQVRIPTWVTIPSRNDLRADFSDDNSRLVTSRTIHTVESPGISPSQTSGIPGSSVTISGEGFKAFVPVASVTIGSIEVTPASRPSTDSNGMTSFEITIPALDPGVHSIEFQAGDLSASAGFTVIAAPTPTPAPTNTPAPTPTATSTPTATATPDPANTPTPTTTATPSPTLTATPTPTPTPTSTPTPTPTVPLSDLDGTIRLSPVRGLPGSVVTVNGAGFAPSERLRGVQLGDINVTPKPRPSADQDGRLTFDFVIPAVDPGTYNVFVKSGWINVAHHQFTVLGPPTPTPPPTPTGPPLPTPAPQLSAGSIPPHVFIGSARLDGNSVSEGTTINAYDGTTLVGATTATPGGRFNIHTLQSASTITFKVAGRPAGETWSTWLSGNVTRNFHLNASSTIQIEDTPASVFQKYPGLVRVFSFDNDSKKWSLYDPTIGDFSDLNRFVKGQTYLFLVSRTTRVLMNSTERHLSCAGGNCWNQIVW